MIWSYFSDLIIDTTTDSFKKRIQNLLLNSSYIFVTIRILIMIANRPSQGTAKLRQVKNKTEKWVYSGISLASCQPVYTRRSHMLTKHHSLGQSMWRYHARPVLCLFPILISQIITLTNTLLFVFNRF